MSGWLTSRDGSMDDAKQASIDEKTLNGLGYKQELTRGMTSFDNWATAFGALYCIGGVQVLFSTSLQEGGPLAMWTNWIWASVFTYMVAASLAEVCSAYPTAGSMYYWAYKCAGPKWGPLLSWIVAWLTVLSWCTNVASDATAGAQFITNEPLAFNITSFDINLDDDVGARAVQFAIATGIVCLSTSFNLMDQKHFRWIYSIFAGLVVVSCIMNMVWLPIAVHRTYGFQNSSVVWTATVNEVPGASISYSWVLGLLYPMYTFAGFDASGHVAEETKNAAIEAPKGIVSAMWTSAVMSFVVLIIFLYCLPDINGFLGSPYNDNVQIIYMYQQALGNNGQAVVMAVGILLWILNATITHQAASRIVYAIARDHVLPGSNYLRARNRYNQPYSAVIFCALFAFVFLCTILPSQIAFTSITSASVVSIVAAYGIVIGCRVTISRKTFVQAEYNLGKHSIWVGSVATVFCGIIFVCLCLPTEFPVTAETFNFAPVILAIWLFISLTYWALSAQFWFKGPVNEFVHSNDFSANTTTKTLIRDDGLVSENEKPTTDFVISNGDVAEKTFV